MNNVEGINTTKRNTINMVHCLKWCDSFLIIEMSQIH